MKDQFRNIGKIIGLHVDIKGLTKMTDNYFWDNYGKNFMEKEQEGYQKCRPTSNLFNSTPFDF